MILAPGTSARLGRGRNLILKQLFMEEFPQNVESVDASIERICDEGKRSGNFDALKKARREGSPEAVLRGVVQIIVAEKREDFRFVFFLKKALLKDGFSFVSEDDVRRAGGDAYQKALEGGRPLEAVEVASALYGKQSKEYQHAWQCAKADSGEKTKETLEGEEEDEEEEWTANIPQNSTIFNLFEAIESGDDNLEHTDIFWSEIHDNFNPEVADELFEIQHNEKLGAGTKVVDFFEKHGYSKKDIEIFLPVKFEKVPTKKK